MDAITDRQTYLKVCRTGGELWVVRENHDVVLGAARVRNADPKELRLWNRQV